MDARVGDRIVVETTTLDVRRRGGVVLEVLGADDQPPYRVRWDDGHESVYFPGADAHVVPRLNLIFNLRVGCRTMMVFSCRV